MHRTPHYAQTGRQPASSFAVISKYSLSCGYVPRPVNSPGALSAQGDLPIVTRNPMAAPNRKGYLRLAAVWSKRPLLIMASPVVTPHALQPAAAQGRPLALDGPLS
jgi:hypothetical protein